MTTYRFLEPLDTLVLRGNKLFGDPGSHGESLVPPWPSVAAGAIRSAMLAAEHVDLDRFASGEVVHPTLGTPRTPGTFRVTEFTLARATGAGADTLHALPADLVAHRCDAGLELDRLIPVALASGVQTSTPSPAIPALARDGQAKAETAVWLSQAGWQQYLHGEMPDRTSLVESVDVWKIDQRVGVGLDPALRRAEDGKLFSTQAVVLAAGYGFLAAIAGAEPPDGVLRFGGDGRAAAMRFVVHDPAQPDYAKLVEERRCRIVLTTPGLFPGGWLPSGVGVDHRFALGEVSGRLVSAAVPRAEVVSGWDLAARRPKAAQRVAPTGSVYWIDDLDATPDALRKLVEQGLWPDEGYDAQRRAEGFNRFSFASY